MGCYIDKGSNYYQGDRIGDDEEVDPRPSPSHIRKGGVWVVDEAKRRASIEAEVNALRARAAELEAQL
jgi:hypothetical protein